MDTINGKRSSGRTRNKYRTSHRYKHIQIRLVRFYINASVWETTLVYIRDGNEIKGEIIRTEEDFRGLDMGKR